MSQSRENEGSGPLYALIVFTFILLLAPQQIFPVLAPLRIAMLSIVLVSMAHVVNRQSGGSPILVFPRGVIIALILLGWAVLTVPLSTWPGGSINFLFEQYFKTLIVFMLIVNVINSRRKLLGISWALVIMAVPLALTAIINLRTGVTMDGGQRIVGYDAPLSENPNDMALLLNLFLPLAIGLFLGTQKGPLKLLLLTVIALMVMAVLATFSRAGFLTLAVTFLCYLVLLRARPQRFFAPAILLMVIVLIPFLPGDYLGRLGTITNIDTDQTGSAQIRMRDTLTALRIVSSQPIVGSGIGMNTIAMNDARGPTWTEIHNVYLTLAVELGLPGVILFIWLLTSAMRAAHYATVLSRNRPEDAAVHGLAEGLKVSLIAFSIAAFFHPVAYHFYFYYIAGLAVATSQIIRSGLMHGPESRVIK